MLDYPFHLAFLLLMALLRGFAAWHLQGYGEKIHLNTAKQYYYNFLFFKF